MCTCQPMQLPQKASAPCQQLCAGYVHGTRPEICPRGCKPSADVGRGETKKQTLLREAMEFQVRNISSHICIFFLHSFYIADVSVIVSQFLLQLHQMHLAPCAVTHAAEQLHFCRSSASCNVYNIIAVSSLACGTCERVLTTGGCMTQIQLQCRDEFACRSYSIWSSIAQQMLELSESRKS